MNVFFYFIANVLIFFFCVTANGIGETNNNSKNNFAIVGRASKVSKTSRGSAVRKRGINTVIVNVKYLLSNLFIECTEDCYSIGLKNAEEVIPGPVVSCTPEPNTEAVIDDNVVSSVAGILNVVIFLKIMSQLYVYNIFQNFVFSDDPMNEDNCEAMFTGSQSVSNVNQASTDAMNKVVNYPPSVKILPPAKSKKRGRPRKATIKSKLDIAIGKMITKERKQRKNKNKGDKNN